MAMQSFTRNYQDNSSETGFSFVFNCDNCGDGCQTGFVECKSVRKGSFLRSLTEGIGTGARMIGLHDLAYGLERGGDLVTRRFDGMSPEWHKEHEVAFQNAMNEAKEQFHRCHGCNTYVCDACFNEEEGLCVNCAPRENTAVSRAAPAAGWMKSTRWPTRPTCSKAPSTPGRSYAPAAASRWRRANSAATAEHRWDCCYAHAAERKTSRAPNSAANAA